MCVQLKIIIIESIQQKKNLLEADLPALLIVMGE
jgi:hypothetical protein